MRTERLAATGVGAAAVAATLFGVLAWNVQARAPLVDFDATASSWLAMHRHEALTTAMLAVSAAHTHVAVTIWSIAFAIVLARRREHYWLVTLGLAVAGGMAINAALKGVFERARPHMDDPLVLLHTFSFPSGHTAVATVFHGVLAAWLWYHLEGLVARTAVIFAAVAMVALVAFSRVYLGAHYPSDVVAAACSSTVWLVACLIGVHALVRRRMEGR